MSPLCYSYLRSNSLLPCIYSIFGLTELAVGLGLYQYPLLQESPCPQGDSVKSKPYSVETSAWVP